MSSFMKTIVLLVIFCVSGLISRAQDTLFQYAYGGIQNDVCHQVKVTSDYGYIMIGTTNSFGHGGTDFYAVKVDSLGKHQWSKAFGGNMADEGYSVEPTFDHGYAFLGWTNSFGNGGYDVLLVKTDSVGNVKWQKTYGGANWDFGYCIRQTADSGFVICGQTSSYGNTNGDVFVVRTDKSGDTIWTRAIGGTGYNVGNSIYIREDSLYIIAGATTAFGKGDTNMRLIKMNNKGVVEIDTTYGCTHITVANSVEGTPDGGYEIAGYTDSVSLGRDYSVVLKTDSLLRYNNGWEMQLNYSGGIGYGEDATECPDGSMISVSTSNSDGLGGYAMHIALSHGPYLVAGPFEGGSRDEEGNSCAYNYGNKNVVFVGATNSLSSSFNPDFTQGLYDFYLVRLKNDTDIKFDNQFVHVIKLFLDTLSYVTAVDEQSPVSIMAKVFPDPVRDFGTVIVQDEMDGKCTFSLYNVIGESVINNIELKPAGHGQLIVHFAKGDLQSGIYFYRIQSSDNKIATGKIIVE